MCKIITWIKKAAVGKLTNSIGLHLVDRKKQNNREENKMPIDETNRNEIEITTYDRLLRAWENSMELVRDYEMYSKRIEDEKVKEVFKQFAETEGMHASKLRELLLEYKKRNQN